MFNPYAHVTCTISQEGSAFRARINRHVNLPRSGLYQPANAGLDMIPIGHLELDVDMREVRYRGERLHLGSRAVEILTVLACARGRLVTKDELLKIVWPGTVVEENNLQVHISALRKVLEGDRELIVTVPGRGYLLATQVQMSRSTPDDVQERAWFSIPPYVSRLVGRDAALVEIATLLRDLPALTLVGAGGIGKTSLAIHAARRIADHFQDGVRFVELGALSDPGQALVAVAEACNLDFSGGAVTAARIGVALGDTQCLLVLDNAEHLIDVVAGLVESLVARCGQLRVLVTSREPLRVEAESIFRVQPLEVPLAGAPLEELLSLSAVQLFLCRAKALQLNVGADAGSIQVVADLCRRLDGIPLAIELAAARAEVLGVEGVYSRLDDRLRVLTGGHRTALPRHQTLRATFDWSYALLEPCARKIFRRLGIFAGAFTFESMCAVVTDADIDIASVITGIGELAAKSLLNVERHGPVASYRLPESTRAYAMDKLRDEGEVQRITARHTRFLQQHVAHGLPESGTIEKRERQAELSRASEFCAAGVSGAALRAPASYSNASMD
jgi:predicted ATPase/DNA-binding winged helix-turn-helix (wHTH) protein